MLLSAWVRERTTSGEPPILGSKHAVLAATLKQKPLSRRIDLLVEAIGDRLPDLSATIRRNELALRSLTWSKSESDFEGLAYALHELGLRKASVDRDWIGLSTAGWQHYEKLKSIAGDGAQAFVAMWFDASMTSIYDVPIQRAVNQAGWRAHRVDRTEHNNKIDDEIVTEIRRSRFLIADFTGQRGGVYFEAGMAMGLGLPVIWTCRKSDLPNVHFDTRQYNFIDWESEAELEQRLGLRITATIGRGPLLS
ncbi:MAG: hypothetical protein JNL56_07125 [Alphaproteobacteria bacterium]|nr:hypothetical protein [Alphaproteobacteria bacterium]